jgi:hypothetical protein
MPKKSDILRFMSLWPPYLGAGVKVRRIAPDFRSVEVEMGLHFWNQNYLGTQFGGSLYSMVDPFFVLMLLENLGRDYVVWDKSASIRFRKPGKGRVRARLELHESRLEEIRGEVESAGKSEPRFTAMVVDEAGETVAEVEKHLWVKKKERTAPEKRG